MSASWNLLEAGERTRMLCEAIVYAGAIAGYGTTADGIGTAAAQAECARAAVVAYREHVNSDLSGRSS